MRTKPAQFAAIGFDSLPPGKRIQRQESSLVYRSREIVSIPFNRESVSKGGEHTLAYSRRQSFPFPSTGKAYPKVEGYSAYAVRTHAVSIPFHRESLSKDPMLPPSPPDGGKFPFPSTGKAYPKMNIFISDLRL